MRMFLLPGIGSLGEAGGRLSPLPAVEKSPISDNFPARVLDDRFFAWIASV